MAASEQTVIALAIVVLAAGGLVWRAVAARGKPGCGDSCGAVSPDAKAFLKKVRKR